MELTNKPSKTPVYLCVILLVIFLVFSQYNPSDLFTNSLTKKPFALDNLENMCIDKANEGTLYHTPELFCHNGPMYYSILGKIKNSSLDSFGFMIFLMSLLLYTSIFVFFYNILKKEVGGFLFFGFFLYVLLIPAYNMFRFDLSDLVAFFLFFTGFYLLFYTNSNLRESIAGFLFAYSFLTKQTYVFPIAIVFFLYIISDLKIITFENKKLAFNKNNIYRVLLFLAPLIALVWISHVYYPLFLTYTFYLGLPSGLSSIFGIKFVPTMLNIFGFESMTLLLLISMFLTSIYFIFKKRTIITLFTFFSIISTFYLFTVGSSAYEYKRLIFIIPFFIIMCCKIANMPRYNLIGRYVLVLMVLILIFPLLKVMYLNFQMSALERDVGQVWESFPEQSLILADKDRLKLYVDKESNTTLISRGMFYGEEAYVSKISEELNLIDRQQWKKQEAEILIASFLKYIEDIGNKKYSAIVFLPMGSGYDITGLISIINHTSEENNIPFKTLFPFPCKVNIPSIEDRCKMCGYKVLAYFLNPNDCNSMKDAVENYYKERLNAICERDKTAWIIITNIIIYNGGQVNGKCGLEGGNLTEKYEGRFYFNKTDFLIILGLALIMAIYFFKLRK